MDDIFHDISKYYAATIMGNLLTVGRIIHQYDGYLFVRDNAQGPLNLDEADPDVTRLFQVVGEIHPLSALDGIMEVAVKSCLYLNENEDSNEIEVRSIHKGMATAIYAKQQCPLIMWNQNYEKYRYFDVIDIKNVFATPGLRSSFVSVIAESLREYELFPPLLHLKK